MYTNPYEEEWMRRRQQQSDIPQFQQPAPMGNLPLYAGPEVPQWTPMGDDSGQEMNQAGAGMASLLRRFRRPRTASPADAKQAWEQGGSL